VKRRKLKLKNIKNKLLALLPLIILISLTFTLVVYFNQNTQVEILRSNIANIEPIFLLVNFLILVFSFVVNFQAIKKRFSKIKLQTWAFLFFIFLIAIFLRAFVTPTTCRIFFDEDIYLETGKEILVRGNGSLCNYGDALGCYEYDLMKWPNGYPFLLAVSYFFAGVSDVVGFNLNIALGSIAVVLIFLITYLITKNERASLFSALFFALIPVHIMWSATAAAEPVLLFFTTLAVFCFLFSFEQNNLKSHIMATASLAYAVQIKPEGLVLLPFFALVVILLDKQFFKKIEDKKFLAVWAIFFFLIIPYLVHMNHSFERDTWGSEGGKFGLEYAAKNIPINLIFWIRGYENIEHPILFTIFAVIGSLFWFFKNKRVTATLLVWFFLMFFLYAFFYAGSVLYGADVRYSLSGYPPLIILAGIGSYSTIEFLKKKRYKRILTLLIVSLTLISFIFYLPSISTPAEDIEEARHSRAYRQFAIKTAEEFDDSCYILSHVPSIYLVMGKNSLQTWNAQNKERMNEIFNKTDCVIFDDGFWCHIEPYESSICKDIFDDYNLVLIEEYQEKTGKTYSFYKVLR